MPAADPDNNQRIRLLPVLFWSGVGLAPLAGLLLLLGNGDTPLRVAAALAVLAVVLIGLSVALRPDAAALRLEMEETLLDEIDMLREDVRDDIATAARATHQGLGERLQALQQMVDTVRGELEMVRNGRPGYIDQARVDQPPSPPAAPRRTPTGTLPAVAHATVGPPASASPRPAYGSSAVPDIGRAAPQSASPEAGRARVHLGPSVPAGMVQHTETVQVTTRSSTYVDRHSDSGDRSRVYGGGGSHRGDIDHGAGRGEDGFGHGENGFRRGDTDHGAGSRSWSTPPAPRSRSTEPNGEPWADQKLREQYARRPPNRSDRTDGRGESWAAREPERPSRRSRSERHASEPSRDGRRAPDPEPEWLDQPSGELAPYPGVRTGARWTEVHADDRGRELRLGERRASAHSDDAGTELRVEDRWASVRQEENSSPDYGSPGHGRPDQGRPDQGRRALPAASSEPSWDDRWDESVGERKPRGRRHRRGEDLDDLSYPATGSQRRIDYELSDERWR